MRVDMRCQEVDGMTLYYLGNDRKRIRRPAAGHPAAAVQAAGQHQEQIIRDPPMWTGYAVCSISLLKNAATISAARIAADSMASPSFFPTRITAPMPSPSTLTGET